MKSALMKSNLFPAGAFRAASWYKFRLSSLFRSVSDAHTLWSVRRKKLLSMLENDSALYCNV